MYTESVVEEATLEWFAELGYAVAHGPDIDPESGVILGIFQSQRPVFVE